MYTYYLQTQCIGIHYRLHRSDDHKHHNINDFTKPTTHMGLQERHYLKVEDNAKYTQLRGVKLLQFVDTLGCV